MRKRNYKIEWDASQVGYLVDNCEDDPKEHVFAFDIDPQKALQMVIEAEASMDKARGRATIYDDLKKLEEKNAIQRARISTLETEVEKWKRLVEEKDETISTYRQRMENIRKWT